MARLGSTRYGKAEVRVVRVTRSDGGDLIRDWTVSSSLSGDIDGTYLTGDNSAVLATDTQKNTVYAFTQALGDVEPEVLGLRLGEHFVGTQAPISRSRVHVEQQPWSRTTGPHSFVRGGAGVRTCTVTHDEQAGVSVVGGVQDLVVMNTTDSEFWGFPRDAYTTMPETKDRMLATSVTAQWRFRPQQDWAELDWAGAYDTAVATFLDTFAGTYSYSLQQTLFSCATAMMDAVPALCEVRMVLPNKHHFLVDLEPFGQPNDNEVYYAADRPYGLIEAAVLADDAPPEGLAWT